MREVGNLIGITKNGGRLVSITLFYDQDNQQYTTNQLDYSVIFGDMYINGFRVFTRSFSDIERHAFYNNITHELIHNNDYRNKGDIFSIPFDDVYTLECCKPTQRNATPIDLLLDDPLSPSTDYILDGSIVTTNFTGIPVIEYSLDNISFQELPLDQSFNSFRFSLSFDSDPTLSSVHLRFRDQINSPFFIEGFNSVSTSIITLDFTGGNVQTVEIAIGNNPPAIDSPIDNPEGVTFDLVGKLTRQSGIPIAGDTVTLTRDDNDIIDTFTAVTDVNGDYIFQDALTNGPRYSVTPQLGRLLVSINNDFNFPGFIDNVTENAVLDIQVF